MVESMLKNDNGNALLVYITADLVRRTRLGWANELIRVSTAGIVLYAMLGSPGISTAGLANSHRTSHALVPRLVLPVRESCTRSCAEITIGAVLLTLNFC